MTGAEFRPEPEPGDEADGTDRADRDGAELPQDARDPTVVTLLARLESLTEHVADLDAEVAALSKEKKAAKATPAEWAWFPVPAVSSHPPATVALWVQFYNATYVTTTNANSTNNDHNRPIPGCWLQHPGLAAEIATLAASWRAAFVGPDADPRQRPELARQVAARVHRSPERVGFLQPRPPLHQPRGLPTAGTPLHRRRRTAMELVAIPFN